MALVRDEDEDEIVVQDEEAEPEEKEEEPQEDEEEDEEKEEASTEEDAAAAEAAKKKRRDRNRERKREHDRIRENELRELREQNQRLYEQLGNVGNRMAESTEAMRQTVDGLSKPKPRPIEDRMAEEMAQAAARVRPAAEDGGASSQAYFREMAAISARYAREIGQAEAQRHIGEAMRQMPRPPSGANLVYLGLAPWLSDDDHNAGVNLEIRRIARKRGLDLNNTTVRDKVIREAIVKYGNAEGLPVHMPTNGGGTRYTPAAGGGGGGARGQRMAGDAGPARPRYTEGMKRMADEDPEFRKIKNPQQRYDAFYEKRVKPEIGKD